MSQFTLYTTPEFSRGTIAQMLLEECGADYDITHINLADLPSDENYRKINPMAKVPALMHDGQVITELTAIVLYLADVYHSTGIAPAPNTAERGQMYRLLFMATHFEYAIFEKIKQANLNDKERTQNGYGSFAAMHHALTVLIADKTYAVGDGYTLLDAYLAMFFMWALQMGALGADDPLVAYAQKHMTRPAISQVMANLANQP